MNAAIRKPTPVMCNAANHPPGCTCGWGGPGHLGRRSGNGIPPSYLGTSRSAPAYVSYVNHNARCPVCGISVFFFQSPDGGRVFFDELGPPWPKHPCTDADGSRRKVHAPSVVASARTPSWERLGWSPLVVSGMSHRDTSIYEMRGKWSGTSLVLFVNKRVHVSFESFKPIMYNTFSQMRRIDNGSFEISFLSQYGLPKSFTAHSSLQDASRRVWTSVLRRTNRLRSDGGEKFSPNFYSTGTVKWFSVDKGYSFIVPDDLSGEVYIHAAVLQSSGVQVIRERQRVRIAIREGRRGLQVQSVRILWPVWNT